MTAQLILAFLASILVWKGWIVLVHTSGKKKPGIFAGFMLRTLGGVIMMTAPLFAPAVIPIGAIYLIIAGEAALALYTRRAQA